MPTEAGYQSRDVAFSVPSFHGRNGVVGNLKLLFGNLILTIVFSCFGILGFSIWSVRRIFLQPTNKKVTAVYGASAVAKSILYILLVVLYLAYFATIAAQDSLDSRRYAIPAAALQLCCTISLALNAGISHVWELRSSSFAQLFLAAWAATDIARIVLLAEGPQRPSHLGLASMILVAKISLLAIEETSKRRLLRIPYNKYPPEALSGIINRAFMCWLNPLMWRGIAGEPLTLPELFDCEPEFTSAGLSDAMGVVWEKHVVRKSKQNLFLTLAWEFRWLFIVPTPTRFAQSTFQFIQPFLIERTLEWYQGQSDSDEPKGVGAGLVLAYGLAYLGLALSTAFSQYQIVRFITAMRGGLVSLIFRKSLQLAQPDMAPLTLMSTDVERIVQGLQYVHEAFVSLFMFIVAMWLLERQLGLGAIAPIVVSVCSMLVIGAFGKKISSAQKRWVESVEKRVGVTTQMLTSMKAIKMSGLSGYCSSLLQSLRHTELVISLAMRRFLTVGIGLSFATPTLSPVVGFAVYVAVASRHGDTLLAAKAFPALALFNLLSVPLGILIQTLPEVIGMFACFDRIGNFLQREARVDSRCLMDPKSTSLEKIPFIELRPGSSSGSSSLTLGRDLVRIVNGTFSRDAESDPILLGVNLHIKRGTVTVLTGPSGSGKTTILEALLGDLPCPLHSVQPASGFDLHHSIAYCSQEPWLRNDTIRNNIVGDMPYGDAWYKTVLRACALDRDISKLNQGMIGNGGTTLSGGQKQRIALARAVYSRRPLILLDDSLAGLDNVSERLIVERLLGSNGLLGHLGTTVIWATQRVKYPNVPDQIILLRGDGTAIEHDLLSDSPMEKSVKQSPPSREPSREANIPLSQNPVAFTLGARFETAAADPRDHRKGELGAYKYYFTSLGHAKLGVAIVLVLSYVFFSSFPQIWLEWWTESNIDRPNKQLGYWIGIYAAFGALAILSLILACWLMICNMVKDSAESLHFKLVKTVASATASVFASTDPGLMVNRFSQDMSLVDMELPMAFANTIINFMNCVAQIIVVCVSSKYLGATVPFVVGAFIVTQRLYIRTSRQLRFFDIEAKGPLYTEFIELLNGLPVIRAFDMQEAFEQRLATALDASQKPFYLLFCAQRWLGLVLNLVNMGLALILVGVTTATRGGSGGFLGVALINLMNFGPSLSDLVNVWSTLETSLAAVERVKYFSEETPTESTEEPVDPPPGWPQAGGIELQDVSLRYSPGADFAIESLSLCLPAGKKIAVCGRSGSGKSTLCMAILRMLDPASGTISIDGQGIPHIPHELLRSALSVVPQESAIIGDSIRANVDPEGIYSDEEVTDALKRAGLWGAVKDRLGTEDNDMNLDSLSRGQKQLLSLARALVKKRTILLLDEATSSLDTATDEMVQTLVTRDLSGTTVVSVIHRLEHVHLYDLAVVLDDGHLVEVGSPEQLLSDPSSALSLLCLYGSDG